MHNSAEKPTPRTFIHPAWRGIGCLLVVLIPIMGWGLGGVFLEKNVQYGWGVPIPPELNVTPSAVWKFAASSGISPEMLTPFYARLMLMVVFSVVVYGVLTVAYSVIYRVSGGGRGSPLDVPLSSQPRRRKR